MRYSDATSFRQALGDHFRARFADQEVGRLLKRVAMERFLARTAHMLGDRALLKGGYALELRLARARATRDVDLALREVEAHDVLEAVRDAGAVDLGDHFTYLVEATTAAMPAGAPYGGQRLTVVPLLGGRRFQPFPLDVGLGDAVPAKADTLRGGIDLSFAGLSVLETPAIPVEVHLAEKLHALSVPHLDDRENSRVKDLVDVMLLLRDAYRDVARVRASVVATFERRATHPMPERFDLPLTAWEAPYRRFALTLELESPAETVALANEQLHELWAAVQGVDDAMP